MPPGNFLLGVEVSLGITVGATVGVAWGGVGIFARVEGCMTGSGLTVWTRVDPGPRVSVGIGARVVVGVRTDVGLWVSDPAIASCKTSIWAGGDGMADGMVREGS